MKLRKTMTVAALVAGAMAVSVDSAFADTVLASGTTPGPAACVLELHRADSWNWGYGKIYPSASPCTGTIQQRALNAYGYVIGYSNKQYFTAQYPGTNQSSNWYFNDGVHQLQVCAYTPNGGLCTDWIGG